VTTCSTSTKVKAAFVAGVLTIALASLFVHPGRRVKAAGGGSETILGGAGANPAVVAIVGRSCQNCHSEKTEWPWYSYIAPMSWLIENDVTVARRHMNVTNWQDYSPAEKIERLSNIAPLVRNRIMPPKRYVILHPEAKLSADDINQLATWTQDERRKLRETSVK
jgi:Haem-binding domain